MVVTESNSAYLPPVEKKNECMDIHAIKTWTRLRQHTRHTVCAAWFEQDMKNVSDLSTNSKRDVYGLLSVDEYAVC